MLYAIPEESLVLLGQLLQTHPADRRGSGSNGCGAHRAAADLRLQQLFPPLPSFRLCRFCLAVDHMQERQPCSKLLFQPHRTL